MSAPPGWYADPSGQPQWRWWDGREWTSHVSAPATPRRPDPRSAIASEAAAARWAPWGFAAQAIASVLSPWGLANYLRSLQPMFMGSFENPETGPTPEMMQAIFRGVIWQQLLSLVTIVALVAIGFWIFRAASAAVALNIPARHEPVWAVVAWFIPIINFWWPCQSLQDLLPPDHPTRRTILLVWVPFVVGEVLLIGGMIPIMFTDSPAALTVLAVGALLTAVGWLSALRLVPVVQSEHERLAAPA